ncbi:MAG: radical SAM protein [Methanothrix sp.]|nr:radical SAM protein [Methanothrix sp.]OPY49472.1 MAG: biotin synthase [Methanosaeta sp. PtaU1.Bin112]
MVMNAEIKALLVSIGSADINEELLKDALRTTRPSAGPGAGIESFFFKSGGHRVRLAANKNSPLKVIKCCSDVILIKDGKPIVSGRLEPALSHCPEQAYLTISGRCVYDCKFCPVPRLEGEIKDREEILELVQEAWRTGLLRAISLTSGVESSAEEEVKRAVSVVLALRARYDVPIGVSVYPTETSSEELKHAGATEIKYNVETMDSEIFSRVCPSLSLEHILKSLEKAVLIFGENRVSSNFILGLGESDECVLAGVAKLADMGVIPILRPISPHPLRKGDIDVKRPSPERLLSLARATKKILAEHDLRPDLAETMCLPCTGCDITPFRDL